MIIEEYVTLDLLKDGTWWTARELVENAAGKLDRANVYLTLATLEERGAVESRPTDTVDLSSGVRRRFFRITGDGRAEFRRAPVGGFSAGEFASAVGCMVILGPIFAAFGSLPIVLTSTWSVWTMYGWFVVEPFGAPHVRYWHALGLALLAFGLRYLLVPTPDLKPSKALWWEDAFKWLARTWAPLLALAVAWAARWMAG
jgi:hypothetical protein